jgi:hypothetical protein
MQGNLGGEVKKIVEGPDGILYAAVNSYNYCIAMSANETSWTSLKSGLPDFAKGNTISVDSNGAIYAGINALEFSTPVSKGVWKSTNNGMSWRAINSGWIPNNPPTISCLALLNPENIYAGTWGIEEQGGMYKTSNDSAWIAINSGVCSRAINDIFITSERTIYIGTNEFINGCHGQVLYSTDGTNWSIVGDQFFSISNTYVQRVVVHGSIIYAIVENSYGWQLLKSKDKLSWYTVWGIPFNATAIFVHSSGRVFCAANSDTSIAVYMSDNDSTWTRIMSGEEVTSFCENKSGRLFAGTLSGNVYYNDLYAVTSLTDNVRSLPEHFSLFQNYPNPFNPTTAIRFEVPAPEFVSLKILDLLGREVTTLFSEKLQPGTYTRQWDAARFPSGVYFYKLQTKEFVETKKLLLIK